MNEPIVHDGEVYPDEMSFVAATHPNIPEEIKRIYVSPKPKQEDDPDSAAGMALEASRKAADALKAAQGTPATVDSDTGIDGPVRHQIPWLRQVMPNLDSNITQGDYDRTEDIGLSFSGGGMSIKGTKPVWDMEQMGNGKYEVFNATTGITHHIAENEAQAKDLVKQLKTDPSQVPNTPEFNAKYGYDAQMKSIPDPFEQVPFGYTDSQWHSLPASEKQKILNNPPVAKDPTQHALDEIEKILNSMDKQDAAQKAGVKNIPITEGKVNPQLHFAQEPLYYHEKTASWEYHPEEVEKLSPKEAFKKGLEEAHGRFKATMVEIQNKLKSVLASPYEAPQPKVQGVGDYNQPAYRGLTVYEPGGGITGKGPNPVYNFDKGQQLYSTAHPELADMYSSGLDKHPGHVVPPGTFQETAQVMPLLINTKNYHYYDAKGAMWQEANPKAMAQARDLKKPGVIVDNVWDEPGSTKALGKPKKIFITFPSGASTVKSRFAQKFDPSSPNILHSVGIGTAATGYVSSEILSSGENDKQN